MNATVGGIISALGQTVQGYGVDKERRIKDALASRKATQDEQRDKVLNALGAASTRVANANATILENGGKDEGFVFDQAGVPYVKRPGGVLRPATVETDTTPKSSAVTASQPVGTPPSAPQVAAPPVVSPKFGPRDKFQRVQVTLNGKPAFVLQDEGGNFVDPANHQPIAGKVEPFVAPSYSFPTGVDDHGKPVIMRGNSKTGALESTGQGAKPVAGGAGSAPVMAKVGQFGEMLKKAHDLLPTMDALSVSNAQSAAEDVAQHGIKVPILGVHIPGTQGVGAAIVNRSPEYATYQAALTPFVLAAAHALSGARINQDQVTQIRKSIEIQPGESPASRSQKTKNMLDLINSIGGSLPPDAIGEQEGQMEPAALSKLIELGYRRAHPHGAAAAPTTSTPTTGNSQRTVVVNGKTFVIP